MRRPSERRWTVILGLLVPLLWIGSSVAEDTPEDEREALARFDARIKPEDREHWAFQPVQTPSVPEVENRAWVKNPIDAFVLAKLEETGWAPAPPAEPRALIRRLFLDVTGLPPSVEELNAFLEDGAPDAYERTVDLLLSSAGYGERWARHWLDLVRFAETNGYERDALKPNAWKYRDYVIRSLNDDKPFDRFLTEQLAGDELPDISAETLIATGFHRLGPWDDEPADPAQDRFDQLDDMVRTTSAVFLGLTLGCARCHDHKFEPLTQLDYYRMVGIFDPLQRPQIGRMELDRPVGTREALRSQAERDRKVEELRSGINQKRTSFRDAYLAEGRSGLPDDVVEALRAEPSKRSPAQKMLADANAEALEAKLKADMPEETRQEIDALEASIRELLESMPDLPRGYFLEEVSAEAPTTHLLLRGQASSPGPRVEPGFPAVLVSEQPDFPTDRSETTGQRLALARWMTSPENPLVARVIVNRVWQFHFGEGIVRSPNDFGTFGEAPTHPELLDWLAAWFVREGWSLKKLHRLILTSNTYRMSKRWEATYAEEDPGDTLLWRFPYHRLEAEAIRDAMLAVSGQLDRTMYGPSFYPEIPREALEAHSDPDKVWGAFDERLASRRTIYAMVRRSLVVPMLEVLDYCDTSQSSPRRSVTSTAPQALTLLNGGFVNRQARHLADRLMRDVGSEPERQIERAYLLALSRPPTDSEREALVQYMERETTLRKERANESGLSFDADEAQRDVLARACRVLFNLNEFVYPD